jgi:hypothetical protein
MSETVKKTTTKAKTTRKPKAEITPQADAKPTRKKATPINGLHSNVTEMKTSHEQVAQLAHQFWAERGYQHGYDAEDWFRAEQQLHAKAS